MFFTRPQISLVKRSFETAEGLVRNYFCLHDGDWCASRYDIRTLAELEGTEVNRSAFAHLCRYHCDKPDSQLPKFLYRICLQDDCILDAIARGKSFIKLYPLLLYIATHELIHVIRFGSGESDFDAPPEEKDREEERVHTITRSMLKALRGKNDFGLVLDCFSNNYPHLRWKV